MCNLTAYFTDPVLRAPTMGCMAMAIASAIVGTFLVLQKRSLLGEALSHAAFPGVVIGVFVGSSFLAQSGELFSALLLAFSFLSALLGLKVIDVLEKRFQIASDAALCFTLSIFFGVGVLIASRMQMIQTAWYKQALVFLYGQAATMMDRYLPVYGILALLTALLSFIFYPSIQVTLFDARIATQGGIRVKRIEFLLTVLTSSAIVVGMRSMGVVLMAGMLIAPTIAARPWCRHLYSCMGLSVFFAMASAFLGNVASVEGTRWLTEKMPKLHFSLPTGPLILIVAAFLCMISLLLSPRGGFISRLYKKIFYHQKICIENLLKGFWRKGKGASMSYADLQKMVPFCRWALFAMQWQKLVRHIGQSKYILTEEGWIRACRIVRLHRLWEVYLVEYMNQGIDRVHCSAEELEHVMDEALEIKLEELLGSLTADPHFQPIPKREIKL